MVGTMKDCITFFSDGLKLSWWIDKITGHLRSQPLARSIGGTAKTMSATFYFVVVEIYLCVDTDRITNLRTPVYFSFSVLLSVYTFIQIFNAICALFGCKTRYPSTECNLVLEVKYDKDQPDPFRQWRTEVSNEPVTIRDQRAVHCFTICEGAKV
ncbi:hypothetical protein VNO78_23325 [Psophocarpus tetragonolobus]|uniref:Uncharacterized protein n=1 Tax=Psophocarpus tetragonolobus TaxID=3891 RepID=A0AAN9S3C0_PSOTE